MARSYLRNLTREPLLSTAWTRETVRQKGLSGQEPRSSVSKIMRRKRRDGRTPLLITSALTVPNGSLAASTNFLFLPSEPGKEKGSSSALAKNSPDRKWPQGTDTETGAWLPLTSGTGVGEGEQLFSTKPSRCSSVLIGRESPDLGTDMGRQVGTWI